MNEAESKGKTILRDTKNLGEKVLDETSPRARESIDQITDVAEDLYGKATDWLDRGNNRNYALLALAASAGFLGFFLGRGARRRTGDIA